MIDLHTHSTFSDGSDTPEELARKAHERGLHAIAMLSKVAAGELTLGLSAEGVEPSVAEGAVETVQAPDRVFNRGNLKGY